MIQKDFPFNPSRDIKAVEPFGYVDLKSCMVNNSVPTMLPDSDVEYNGIEDPRSILGRPSDVFEAMHMEKSIGDYKPEEKATE